MPVLYHESRPQIIIPNAGGISTTDWVDTNADGLADNWVKAYGSAAVAFSIVNGNGFTGNAQRYELTSTYMFQALSSSSIIFEIGKRYTVSLKYRMNGTGVNLGMAIYSGTGQSLATRATKETGNAYLWTFTTPVITFTGAFTVYFGGTTHEIGDYFEVDEINVQRLDYNVLTHQSPLPVIVTNGGGQGTTDWVDSNADGLADGWSALVSPTCSIVTGNGFTGNAQRLQKTTVGADVFQFTPTVSPKDFSGKKYNISVKFRGSFSGGYARFQWGISGGVTGTIIYFTENTGNAAIFTANNVTAPALSTSILFTVYTPTAQTIWVEIDEINITEVENYNVIQSGFDTIKITMTPTAGFQAGITTTFASGTVTINWGDGTIENFTTNVEKLHTYTNAGTYVAEIYGSLTNITSFVADNCRITHIDGLKTGLLTYFRLDTNLYSGVLDMSKAPISVDFRVQSNANLTNIIFAKSGNARVTNFIAQTCNLTGILDLSSVTIGTQFWVSGNPNLTNVTFASSGNLRVSGFQIHACNITGTLDLTNVPIGGSLFYTRDNPNLTAINFATSGNAKITGWYGHNTGISTLDLTNVPVGGVLQLYNNTILTSITFASSGNAIVTDFQMYGCTLLTSLDLTNLPIGTLFNVYSCPNLTSITFASSGNSALSYANLSINNLSSIDFTNVPIANATNGYLQLQSNPNLNSVTFASSGNGLMKIMRFYYCNLHYVNIIGSGFNLSINLAEFALYGLGVTEALTASEVNHMLVDLYSLVSGEPGGGSYTGRTINLKGSNAAPDGTSGGYDGLTAKSNLQGKGFTVTTN